MPKFGPIKRRELIHYLRELGFEGPYVGGTHQYMVKGEIRLAVPNPHQSDISRDLLARILRQAGIDRERNGNDFERSRAAEDKPSIATHRAALQAFFKVMLHQLMTGQIRLRAKDFQSLPDFGSLNQVVPFKSGV